VQLLEGERRTVTVNHIMMMQHPSVINGDGIIFFLLKFFVYIWSESYNIMNILHRCSCYAINRVKFLKILKNIYLDDLAYMIKKIKKNRIIKFKV